MEKIIKNISKRASASLQNVYINGAKKTVEFQIDCTDLEDYNQIDIRQSENYREMFAELQTLSGPCLYFFEITSDNKSIEIIEKIKEYSAKENSKKTPAMRSRIIESKILYVGKVKRSFWGRLIQHLGYFKTPQTQGLQLFYWAREINLNLKLTVFEFESEMINLMEVLENDLARHLNPILGKHK